MNQEFKTHFTLSLKEWNKFLGYLNRPAKFIPKLFDACGDVYTCNDTNDYEFGNQDFTFEFSIKFPEIDIFMTNRFLRRQ